MAPSRSGTVLDHGHLSGTGGDNIQLEPLGKVQLNRSSSRESRRANMGLTLSREPSKQASIQVVETPVLSRPVSHHDEPRTASREMRRKERIYFAACCFALFIAGWNDASAGPLLPRMQKSYHVGFAVVSLIFVSNCVGFLSAAVTNIWLTDRYGFGVVMFIGSLFQVAAFSVQSSQPPFPLLVVAYAFNGFGMALQDAQANGLVAYLPTSPGTKMGILHAIYGVGALSAPLVATQFAQQKRWSFHFLASLGVGLVNSIISGAVFRLKTQDRLLGEVGVVNTTETSPETTREGGKYGEIMRLKAVHLMALFILVYVGTEVTIGGWIVTYVIDERGGGSSAGYVSSGFFAGLTLGRVMLIQVNRWIGERRVIYLYCVLGIALEFTIWFVPSLVGNAVAVSFVGFILGPFYPIVMNISAAILPRRVLTESIGWIASIGQTGSAAFPFFTGVLSQKYGVKVLQPLLVAMMSTLLVIWFFVPSPPRRMD